MMFVCFVAFRIAAWLTGAHKANDFREDKIYSVLYELQKN